MKIVAMFFKEKNDIWQKLYDVFVYSVKKNVPNFTLEIIEVDKPVLIDDIEKKRSNHKWGQWALNNLEKIVQWNKYIQSANENTILVDGDIIIRKDPSDAFKQNFDIAYTSCKRRKKNKINTGVIFVRPNKNSKLFFQNWYNNTVRMFNDEEFYGEWVKKLSGITQPAFLYTLENSDKINTKILPGNIYNTIDPDWDDISKSKIIHIKGQLQKMVTEYKKIKNNWKPPYNYWKKLEKEMNKKWK